MHASLTTTTFDPLGHVEVDLLPESKSPERLRRMNRIATLDGGAVTNDSGYSDADLTIDLRWAPTQATDEAVERLLRLYARINVATRDGVFRAGVESFRPGTTESILRLLVIERLSVI